MAASPILTRGLLALPLAMLLAGNGPAPVTGRWLVADKSAIVSIAPCGSRLCGKVDRILTNEQGGANALDARNPDPALRKRRIQGLTLLSGFQPKGSEWHGQIYDPKTGKTYRSVLKRQGAGLTVKGCIAFLCRSQDWTPAR